MNFFKEHNIFSKILSLLIAIFLWSYVVLEINPARTPTFANKPVELVGVEVLEERGLVLVNAAEPKITIRVTGTSKDMVNLSAGDIRAEIDFSSIEEAGIYYLLPEVSVPKPTDAISFQPQRLQFTVENIKTKDVPVRVTTRNELSGDRLIDKLAPSQTTIGIRGAESVVSTVKYALLTVDLDNISRDMVQTCRVTLYSGEDALLDSALVVPEKDALDVAITLNHVATVPLSVSLLATPDLTRDMVEAQIVPQTVRVYGSKSEVDKLVTLSLGNIDLKNALDDGQEVVLSIKLPQGIRLMKNEPQSARVKLVMKANVKRTLRVTEIALIDESGEPEKPRVSLISASLGVEIQGKANVVAGLTAANIHAEAVFDSSALGTGTHTVPVRITIETGGISVISENLTAQISIAEQEEIQP